MARFALVAFVCAATWLALAGPAAAQAPPSTSWMDGSTPGPNWNIAGGTLPTAPPLPGTLDLRCTTGERPAESPEDERVTSEGWRLYREYEAGWGARLVYGTADYDGMCRPRGFQVFVFSGGAFAGTLSPQAMDSRSDGALQSVQWLPPNPAAAPGGAAGTAPQLLATYARYEAEDPLCCPSRTTDVTFELAPAEMGTAVAVPVSASASAPSGDSPPGAAPGPPPGPPPGP